MNGVHEHLLEDDQVEARSNQRMKVTHNIDAQNNGHPFNLHLLAYEIHELKFLHTIHPPIWQNKSRVREEFINTTKVIDSVCKVYRV